MSEQPENQDPQTQESTEEAPAEFVPPAWYDQAWAFYRDNLEYYVQFVKLDVIYQMYIEVLKQSSFKMVQDYREIFIAMEMQFFPFFMTVWYASQVFLFEGFCMYYASFKYSQYAFDETVAYCNEKALQ